MTRQIAHEALIAAEYSGLPFHDSFHGPAVNGRWPPQQSGPPPALALRVLAVPVLPIVAADGVGPAAAEDDHGLSRRSDVRPIARWLAQWYESARMDRAPCSIRGQFTKEAQSIRAW